MSEAMSTGQKRVGVMRERFIAIMITKGVGSYSFLENWHPLSIKILVSSTPVKAL